MENRFPGMFFSGDDGAASDPGGFPAPEGHIVGAADGIAVPADFGGLQNGTAAPRQGIDQPPKGPQQDFFHVSHTPFFLTSYHRPD